MLRGFFARALTQLGVGVALGLAAALALDAASGGELLRVSKPALVRELDRLVTPTA